MDYIIKPPLGVTPKYIHDMSRIQDLCRALYEYSICYPIESKADFMCEWAVELCKLLKEFNNN